MKRLPLTTYLSAYLPIIAWAGVIFYLSNQSTLPGPDVFALDYIFKKSAHMFVYFVFFLLTHRAVKLHRFSHISASYIALIITFIYALTDEYHQTFIPGRTGTLKDLNYDLLGMCIAWLWSHKYI